MKSLRLWLIFAVFSVALVPTIVFLGGWWLAGPYQGTNGVFGMMGAMYRDALAGHLSALVLLFGPLLLAAIWIIAFWLRRSIGAGEAPESPQPQPGQGQ